MTARSGSLPGGAQERAAGWYLIAKGNSRPMPSSESELRLEALDSALAEILMAGPRYVNKLKDLTGPSLEKEIAAALGSDPEVVSKIIAKGLDSSRLIDQSIAQFAQGNFAMAEAKSLEAAKQAEPQEPALAAAAYLRAGDACVFKIDQPAAIEHYRTALALPIPEFEIQLKFSLLTHLGRALQVVAGKDPESPANQALLQETLESNLTASKLVSREKSPEGWALNLLEKARILGTLAQGKPDSRRRELLTEAKSTVQLSLEALDRKVSPNPWLRAQHALGTLSLEQAQGLNTQERMPFLNEAVEIYRNALESLEGGRNPARRAAMLHNLAIALQRRCFAQTAADGVLSLRDALKAYQDSMEFYTREDYPLSWAQAQTYVGLVCRMMATAAKIEMKLKMLGHAETAYRLALEVLTRGENPEEWASAQEGLGNTFEERGDARAGAEQHQLWQEAEKRYLSALEIPPPASAMKASPSSLQRRLDNLRKKMNPLR